MICNEFLLWPPLWVSCCVGTGRSSPLGFLNPARPDHHVIDDPTLVCFHSCFRLDGRRFDKLFRFHIGSLIHLSYLSVLFPKLPRSKFINMDRISSVGQPIVLVQKQWFHSPNQIPIRWIRWIHQSLESHESHESHGPFSVVTACRLRFETLRDSPCGTCCPTMLYVYLR